MKKERNNDVVGEVFWNSLSGAFSWYSGFQALFISYGLSVNKSKVKSTLSNLKVELSLCVMALNTSNYTIFTQCRVCCIIYVAKWWCIVETVAMQFKSEKKTRFLMPFSSESQVCKPCSIDRWQARQGRPNQITKQSDAILFTKFLFLSAQIQLCQTHAHTHVLH